MVDTVTSSYYLKASFEKKGNHLTAVTFHQNSEFVSQSDVEKYIIDISKHEFIDFGHRLMTKKRWLPNISQKTVSNYERGRSFKAFFKFISCEFEKL